MSNKIDKEEFMKLWNSSELKKMLDDGRAVWNCSPQLAKFLKDSSEMSDADRAAKIRQDYIDIHGEGADGDWDVIWDSVEVKTYTMNDWDNISLLKPESAYDCIVAVDIHGCAVVTAVHPVLEEWKLEELDYVSEYEFKEPAGVYTATITGSGCGSDGCGGYPCAGDCGEVEWHLGECILLMPKPRIKLQPIKVDPEDLRGQCDKTLFIDDSQELPFFEGERVLSDDYPMYEGYYYVADGSLIKAINLPTNPCRVEIYKSLHARNEIRNCNILARGLEV